MGQDRTVIARDFADTLKAQGLLLPQASLYTSGLGGSDKVIYRIKTKYLYSCFLLKRKGLYTVYARLGHGGYREAFREAL